MKIWKQKNLEEARLEVVELEDDGHKVIMCTDYHWKIDGMDVWPSAKKYMKGGVVKHYDKLKEIL